VEHQLCVRYSWEVSSICFKSLELKETWTHTQWAHCAKCQPRLLENSWPGKSSLVPWANSHFRSAFILEKILISETEHVFQLIFLEYLRKRCTAPPPPQGQVEKIFYCGWRPWIRTKRWGNNHNQYCFVLKMHHFLLCVGLLVFFWLCICFFFVVVLIFWLMAFYFILLWVYFFFLYWGFNWEPHDC
jgi:hypothetical protein